MPSRGNRVSAVGEYALRAIAVTALALAAWQRLHPAALRLPVPERADGRSLPAALARWSAAPVPTADASLDTLPDAPTRAWLAALAATGTRVTWRALRAGAVAASAAPIVDPAGGLRLDVVAPDGIALAVRDALGPLDSARGSTAGTTFRLTDAGPGLAVHAAGTSARPPMPRALPRLGAAVVLARAGWEAKFTAAALEERGWTVRTRLAVDPDIVVGGSTTLPRLDTSAVAIVLALDSSAASLAPAIAHYVRSGGGLVLAGEAALVPALATLAPATPAPVVVDDTAGAIRPLERLRADATPLATRPVGGARALVAAARRVGAGRVVQIADEATWHRRFRADETAPAAHRAWWAQVVAAAAYAGTPPPDTTRLSPFASPAVDPAPLAATVAALGPPSAPSGTAAVAGAPPERQPVPDAVLIPLALAALLAEVASRRLRGAA